jgi:glycosyltransferase involved in cell wall biosynthesis
MACEAVVVASDTAPVREVIQPGSNGLLVDFFDGDAIACKVADVLADPASYRHLGLAARRTVVSNYDLRRVCLPRQLALVDQLAAGSRLNAPAWPVNPHA